MAEDPLANLMDKFILRRHSRGCTLAIIKQYIENQKNV